MPKKSHHARLKDEAKNTIQPAPVALNEAGLEILDNIMKHWNKSKKPETPAWDARTVLGELARLAVVSMAEDYADPPEGAESAPLDPPPPTQ